MSTFLNREYKRHYFVLLVYSRMGFSQCTHSYFFSQSWSFQFLLLKIFLIDVFKFVGISTHLLHTRNKKKIIKMEDQVSELFLKEYPKISFGIYAFLKEKQGILLRMMGYVSTSKFTLVGSLILTIFDNTITLVQPLILKELLDNAIPTQDYFQINKLAFLMV